MVRVFTSDPPTVAPPAASSNSQVGEPVASNSQVVVPKDSTMNYERADGKLRRGRDDWWANDKWGEIVRGEDGVVTGELQLTRRKDGGIRQVWVQRKNLGIAATNVSVVYPERSYGVFCDGTAFRLWETGEGEGADPKVIGSYDGTNSKGLLTTPQGSADSTSLPNMSPYSFQPHTIFDDETPVGTTTKYCPRGVGKEGFSEVKHSTKHNGFIQVNCLGTVGTIDPMPITVTNISFALRGPKGSDGGSYGVFHPVEGHFTMWSREGGNNTGAEVIGYFGGDQKETSVETGGVTLQSLVDRPWPRFGI